MKFPLIRSINITNDILIILVSYNSTKIRCGFNGFRVTLHAASSFGGSYANSQRQQWKELPPWVKVEFRRPKTRNF